jgi:energy-coupling factor transporter ATP-binding protein EcfA2
MTVVIVTHEADIAAWARRRLVFRDGLIVEDVRQPGHGPAKKDGGQKDGGQIPIQEGVASGARDATTKSGSDPLSQTEQEA